MQPRLELGKTHPFLAKHFVGLQVGVVLCRACGLSLVEAPGSLGQLVSKSVVMTGRAQCTLGKQSAASWEGDARRGSGCFSRHVVYVTVVLSTSSGARLQASCDTLGLII